MDKGFCFVFFLIEQGRPLSDAFSWPKKAFSFAQIFRNFKSQLMERLATA